MNTGFCRLHWVMLIVDGRGWTCKIIDFVHLNVEGKRYVMTDKLEPGMAARCSILRLVPVKEIVHTNNVMPVGKKAITKMRA